MGPADNRCDGDNSDDFVLVITIIIIMFSSKILNIQDRTKRKLC